jgi:hypothetical protein
MVATCIAQMDATIAPMLGQLSYGGRVVPGFGLGATATLDASGVLSSLGFNPQQVLAQYQQEQQGAQQMASIFGKAEAISNQRDACLKGCGADQNCMNQCSKAAVLALEGLATSLFTAFNPLVGAGMAAFFAAANSIFGFAGGVADPRCPNGPLPWPPAPDDQTALNNAAQAIFTGTTQAASVTDPFLLGVYAAWAQNSALIENCHWDHGTNGTAIAALLLQQWNESHIGAGETITRTVIPTSGSNPADFDQWSTLISRLFYAVNPNSSGGVPASITVNRGGSLNPNVVVQQGGTSTAMSGGAKLALGTVAVAGVGAAGVGAYALSKGISFAKAWRDLTGAFRGGDSR